MPKGKPGVSPKPPRPRMVFTLYLEPEPELHAAIKRHPEINWSEVTRRLLREFVARLESLPPIFPPKEEA